MSTWRPVWVERFFGQTAPQRDERSRVQREAVTETVAGEHIDEGAPVIDAARTPPSLTSSVPRVVGDTVRRTRSSSRAAPAASRGGAHAASRASHVRAFAARQRERRVVRAGERASRPRSVPMNAGARCRALGMVRRGASGRSCPVAACLLSVVSASPSWAPAARGDTETVLSSGVHDERARLVDLIHLPARVAHERGAVKREYGGRNWSRPSGEILVRHVRALGSAGEGRLRGRGCRSRTRGGAGSALEARVWAAKARAGRERRVVHPVGDVPLLRARRSRGASPRPCDRRSTHDASTSAPRPSSRPRGGAAALGWCPGTPGVSTIFHPRTMRAKPRVSGAVAFQHLRVVLDAGAGSTSSTRRCSGGSSVAVALRAAHTRRSVRCGLRSSRGVAQIAVAKPAAATSPSSSRNLLPRTQLAPVRVRGERSRCDPALRLLVRRRR